ncbi:MAG: S-formylglutathione hydrolase [Pseudomonadales bacterium]|nr:S-formylglutathione hydrolase [Pseudomonadales bacterium]
MEVVNEARLFNGLQLTYRHTAFTLNCDMNFSVYVPDQPTGNCLIWLSGLTCTEENFTTKAGAQRVASELGLTLVAPDTSPRGDGVPDDADSAYDFGLGAGFYVNAIESPWDQHYQMHSYIEKELYNLVCSELNVDSNQIGIFGHSMGGHGALTMALRSPDQFKSVSAFAPICSPINCPWGQKALPGYLGDDPTLWRNYDACALIEGGARVKAILVDQGAADGFLEEQLKPELLQAACETADIDLTLRMQPAFDHSYYFIASFIEDHLHWHNNQL